MNDFESSRTSIAIEQLPNLTILFNVIAWISLVDWPFWFLILKHTSNQCDTNRKKIDRFTWNSIAEAISLDSATAAAKFLWYYLDFVFNGKRCFCLDFSKIKRNHPMFNIMMECRRVSHRSAYTSKTYAEKLRKYCVCSNWTFVQRKKKRKKESNRCQK